VNGVYSLTVRDVGKTYRGGTAALSKIGFDIMPGEVVALLGPNGSGKSTLFRCIVGLEKADSGEIQISGVNVIAARGRKLQDIRTHVGLVFQKFNLVESLSVFHNVLFGAMGRTHNPLNWLPGTASHTERMRAMECLERVKLDHLADRKASALSGGQQQRVAIARMLMQDPKIILADEPVASLDPKAGQEVMDLLLDIARERGLTVVCILHQLDFAMKYADRILGLNAGKLILDSRKSELERGTLEALYGMKGFNELTEQPNIDVWNNESHVLTGGVV
jgi:phosphonate transport system ATP-binding protein